MLLIVFLWFAINGPLVSLGAYFATKNGVSFSVTGYISLKHSPHIANTSTSSRQLDPSPNPTSTLLPAADPFRLPFRNSPVRRSLHRRLLPSLFDFRLACLLRLWLSSAYLCRRHRRHGHRDNPVRLFPPLCRGLPVAVEEFPCRWRERALAVALRSVLLGIKNELGLPRKCCFVLWVSSTGVHDELYHHW